MFTCWHCQLDSPPLKLDLISLMNLINWRVWLITGFCTGELSAMLFKFQSFKVKMQIIIKNCYNNVWGLHFINVTSNLHENCNEITTKLQSTFNYLNAKLIVTWEVNFLLQAYSTVHSRWLSKANPPRNYALMAHKLPQKQQLCHLNKLPTWIMCLYANSTNK